ncbi:MAG: archaemetzincin family Zn-dependent metalloprotease [Promethearchaeota archaeon]|nr:MAG: archaemetzincin family Zn-dependent metalloprotease [Candidatus Lokiarchaeota archaeon]
MKKNITLLRIGQVDQSILDKLKKELELSFINFKLSIDPLKEIISLEPSEYNTNRLQYNASKILNRIINYELNKKSFRILGIIDEDIFTNSLNFVFGLAMSPKGKLSKKLVVALISITRLREKFYRRAENKKIFELRVLKEAIHELGHTFNLGHCKNFCIMRFSNSLADTDKKSSKFCDVCLKKLQDYFNKIK